MKQIALHVRASWNNVQFSVKVVKLSRLQSKEYLLRLQHRSLVFGRTGPRNFWKPPFLVPIIFVTTNKIFQFHIVSHWSLIQVFNISTNQAYMSWDKRFSRMTEWGATQFVSKFAFILSVISVTIAAGEQSFLRLKTKKTYLWSSYTQERLCWAFSIVNSKRYHWIPKHFNSSLWVR